MAGTIDVDANNNINNNNSALVTRNSSNDVRNNDRVSVTSSDSNSAIVFRSKITNLLRSRSVGSRSSRKSSNHSVLESVPSVENLHTASSTPIEKKTSHKNWNTIVTVVLVKAKNLPDPPDDGASHNLYCKFRLGSETFKSKSVSKTAHPEWRERFDMHLHKDHLLRLSLWDKGKQKNFMGSAVLDLASYEKERTHQIWQELDDGFGSVHFSVTMCKVRDRAPSRRTSIDEGVVIKAKHAINNLKCDWNLVGQLYVKVLGAKGLSGKPNAYCTLELDNERVQTHSARASSEPSWDKSYVFNLYDVTSTLDLKVYDSSIVTALRSESLGRISIPLLRINNGETKWFALKGRNNRDSAKGNCPRVQLEMTMFWNPVKATARLFRPKEVKYLKKPPKFDVALVYSNMQFVRDTFMVLYEINEQYKRFLEWDNTELSFTVLVCWLLFWLYFRLWATPLLLLIPFFYYWITQPRLNGSWSGTTLTYSFTVLVGWLLFWLFRLWATPLLLLIPFFYYWITQPRLQERPLARSYNNHGDESPDSDNDKTEKGLTSKIQGLPEMTLTITGGVEYSVSLAERLHNLASFKVPFLSFLTMILLVIAAAAFYLIPINYIMMAFGIYKFSRKNLNPEWTMNNDLLDFISRIPDNEIWKDWKELSVPEPTQLRRQSSINSRKSDSSNNS